ncbi:MAG: hypothetical protein JW917_09260 [Ignavibacteria bacterium]|nr:hypothetical protein [Ignavibacteria bacterium]
MKKFIVILITLVVIFLSAFTGTVNANTAASGQITVSAPVDNVEYMCIDGQWFKVTYYQDGKIDVTPVARPPLF